MYDQRFFASKLGLSALVSVAAMVSFTLFAMAQQAPALSGIQSGHGLVAVQMVELA
jgi:hypothetical protein